MKTKLTDAQKIERIARRHGDEGWTFYARYSGRCMFGAVCPGIVCSQYDAPKAHAAVERALQRVIECSYDHMGLDVIIYFPGVESDPETTES